MATPNSNRKYLNIDRAAHLLTTWQGSGLSLKEFAESHDVSEGTLIRWQRRLHASPTSREIIPAFVQVEPMTMGEITVHARGISIQIPAILLEQSLPSIMRALQC